MSYVSPITVAIEKQTEQFKTDVEKSVLKAVYNVGVVVDKEELNRALKYDRNQYDEGYLAGKEATAREIFDKLIVLSVDLIDFTDQAETVVRLEEIECFFKEKYGVTL